MKSVLISIQPKWCELIASGKKIVEVRKTRPKIEALFKVYIYCTLSGSNEFFKEDCNGDIAEWNKSKMALKKGKVIGEFVCDDIFTDKTFGHYGIFKTAACMSDADISAYCLNKEIYCWHISNLVIYDKPKELSEFYRWTDYDDSKKDKRPCSFCEHNAFDYSENCEYCSIDYDGEHCVHLQMKRPPQSWCYVEHPTEKGAIQNDR